MRFLQWLPPLIWAFIILSASTDTFSSGNTAGWLEMFAGEHLPDFVNVAIRKGGHVVAYAILAALTWNARRGFTLPLALSALVALADEGRQSLTQLREGSPWDVLLDTCSAAVTLLILEKYRRTRLHQRER